MKKIKHFDRFYFRLNSSYKLYISVLNNSTQFTWIYA